MPRFAQEPPFKHGSVAKTAVLLVNLGTPHAPTAPAVRRAGLLAGSLGGRVRSPLVVDYAMRYGEPSIGGVLARLKAAGCGRILVLPLYPQYAASTTGTAFD